nr:compactin diketide synthase mokb [Quercus suber]
MELDTFQSWNEDQSSIWISALSVADLATRVANACRLPGGINSPEDLWDFLLDKRSGYSEFPTASLNVESWHHPEKVRPGSMISRGGFFVQNDLNDFDNDFFGLNAIETSSMDPAQKQMLEIAYEALESAGVSLDEIAGEKIGVYVGNMGSDQALKSKETEHANTYTSTGISPSILSNRISFALGLMGPSLTVDTACSSSLYALHLACAGLRNGDCEGALVCAPNATRSVEAQLFSSKLGALSPDSRCHTFDATANGYARADAFCGLYIMRLSDAIRCRYPIRAVIRGTAVGANGHGQGLTHPESAGQASVIRQAYANAGISDFQNTGYFECHGTGTAVGDPIETHSISTVFADSRSMDNPLLIGSVKTNLGHGEGAAGITAVIKTVLALEHGCIPPTIGVVNPNPAIDFDRWKLKVVTDALPWPAHIAGRRASINSFGYGGANAHVIIERLETLDLSTTTIETQADAAVCATPSTPSSGIAASEDSSAKESLETKSSLVTDTDCPAEKPGSSDDTPKLVLCTAKSEESLNKTIRLVHTFLEKEAVEDVAFTLKQRTQFALRAIAVVEKDVEPCFRRGKIAPILKLGFVFTGQGAQWPHMGRQLLRFPGFLASIRHMDLMLAALPTAPDFTLEEMLHADLSPSELDEPRVAQCISIALEVALVDLLAEWGIRPAYVAGHSAGEVAAAYAAGYLTMSEAIAVAFYRGRAVSEAAQLPGGMLAVGVPAGVAETLIPAGANVVIGADNSPRSATLSGDASIIETIRLNCNEEKIFNRLVATKGRAYHHAEHMRNAAEAYSVPLRDMVRSSEPRQIVAEYYSTVTGKLWTDPEIPMSYWRRNMECPVMFQQAVSAMRTAGATVMVEVGPHATLRTPILDIVKSIGQTSAKPFTYLSCLRRNEDDVKCILNMCGELALIGHDVDIDRVNQGGSLLRTFPSYQWDHTSKYVTYDRTDEEWRKRKFPRHDLLGSLRPGSALTTPIWRNILSINNVPWLAHHKVGTHTILPAAGFLAMAVEAIKQVPDQDGDVLELENISIDTALIVDTDVETFFAMRKLHAGNDAVIISHWWDFDVSSVRDGLSTTHARGRIRRVTRNQNSHCRPVSPSATIPCGKSVSSSEWYDQIMMNKGVSFGKSFQRLSAISVGMEQEQAMAQLSLQTQPDVVGMKYESSYVLHPTVIDNCMQLSVLAAGKGNAHQAYVPVSVERVTIFESRKNEDSATLMSTGKYVGFKGLHGTAQLTDSNTGKTIVSLENLRFVGLATDLDEEKQSDYEQYWKVVWDDDYDAITKDNEKLYFPDDEYRPYEYDHYPRTSRAYLAQMMVKQFSTLHPELMISEPVTLENKFFIEWAQWLLQEIERDHPVMSAMSVEDRHNAIESQRTLTTQGYRLTWAVWDNLADIIRGEKSSLEVATQDGSLAIFYETQLVYNKFERAIEVMGFKNPGMRILEIGAGTGSATRLMLKSLTTGGTKRYASLTYTDISPAFFEKASIEFAEYEDIEYKVYNMDNALEPQDIEAESYDLVVASCVVHVTEHVVSALKGIKKLLRPGGKLLLLEITAEWHDQTFILGTFPGYFKGYAEGRTRHPFLSTDQWADAFLKAGFSTPELSVNDIEKHHGFTVLTTEALPVDSFECSSCAPTTPREQSIALVCWEKPTAFSTHLEKVAREMGLSVEHRSFLDEGYKTCLDWTGSTRIIVIAELEKDFWHDVAEPAYGTLQKMTRTARSILWVTQGGLMKGKHPEASFVNCFFQSLDSDAALAAASMDFETSTVRDESMARQILYRELSLLRNRKEKQFRQCDGKWLVPRLVPENRLNNDFARAQGIDTSTAAVPLKDIGPVEISTTDPGRLTALHFRDDPTLSGPLPSRQVDVQVKAVGMNIMELHALNGSYDTNDPSSEFAGVVTQVSEHVHDLAVGDRVYAIYKGKFGSHVRLRASLCQKVATHEHSFADLATLPLAYSSAFHALANVVRAEAGQSVLIETASDAFGLAAIAIARHRGADVFVTEGTDDKREYLHHLGIPGDHIFSATNMCALTDMMKVTKNQGFDIILNTSSGDYLQNVSLPAVANFGHFVNIRTSNVFDTSRASLSTLSRCVSFSTLDMRFICEERPQLLASTLESIATLYHDKKIVPLPLTSFPVSKIAEAYTTFSRFSHIGKMVLTYEDGDRIPYMPTPSIPKFDSNAAYLIVGGLTGIGGLMCRIMVERGARNMILMDSSTVSDEAQEIISNIRSMGAAMILVQGTVSNRKDVERAMTITGLPLRGVFHQTVVPPQKRFDTESVEEIHHIFGQNFYGNINLHEMSVQLGYKLDYFVIVSSWAVRWHDARHSYDPTASFFVDEFAHWRRSQGLVASTINTGVISGMYNEDETLHLKNAGYYTMEQSETLDLLETALFRQESIANNNAGTSTAIGLDPAKLVNSDKQETSVAPFWQHDNRWAIVRAHIVSRGNDVSRIGTTEASDTKGDVKDLIIERLAKLLWMPTEKIKGDASLASLGVDSMLITEFRHWLTQALKKSVSIMQLLSRDMTVEKLAAVVKGGE